MKSYALYSVHGSPVGGRARRVLLALQLVLALGAIGCLTTITLIAVTTRGDAQTQQEKSASEAKAYVESVSALVGRSLLHLPRQVTVAVSSKASRDAARAVIDTRTRYETSLRERLAALSRPAQLEAAHQLLLQTLQRDIDALKFLSGSLSRAHSSGAWRSAYDERRERVSQSSAQWRAALATAANSGGYSPPRGLYRQLEDEVGLRFAASPAW